MRPAMAWLLLYWPGVIGEKVGGVVCDVCYVVCDYLIVVCGGVWCVIT